MRTIVKSAPVDGCKDFATICDLGEFHGVANDVPRDNRSRRDCTSGRAWTGGKSYAQSLACLRDGDLSGVAASDKLLGDLEDKVALSHTWKTVLDVTGGCPNVPAYLSGQPLNMRRRQRVLSEQGPLCVFASLELSAGIDAPIMRKRGASLLAMVRLLSRVRSVELWVCCSIGHDGYGSHVLVRLDTAPLDLARAAHVLTCPSITRGIGYAVCSHLGKQNGKSWQGNWAYGDVGEYRRTALDNFKSMVNPNAEAILLPAAHMGDPCVNDPVKWLKGMLAKYGGMIED